MKKQQYTDREKRKIRRDALSAYGQSLPSLLLILLIVIFPIIYTGYISLTNMNVYHWNNYELIGLENVRVLSPQKGALLKLVTFVPEVYAFSAQLAAVPPPILVIVFPLA